MALGRKWFGKIGVALFGRDKWEGQDASQVWSDGGAIREVLDKASVALEKIVAENAVLAVSDFASTGVAALRATEQGELILGVRLETDHAAQILEIPLRQLFMAALTDIKPKIGLDAEAQAAVSAMVALGQQLASLGRPPAPPRAPAPPPPPIAPRSHQQAAAKTNAPRGRVQTVGQRNAGASDETVRNLKGLVSDDAEGVIDAIKGLVRENLNLGDSL